MTDSTLAELMAQRIALDEQIAEVKVARLRDVTQQVHEILKANGIEIEEAAQALLGGRKKAKTSTGKKVAPKFLHIDSNATWTGRGKAPAWFSQAGLESGAIALMR